MQYAQIIDNKVNLIECEPVAVQGLRNAGLTIIDLYDINGNPLFNPMPGTGWPYDAQNNTFTAPEIPEIHEIFLHVTITGGDGENPPGIENDGSDYLTFSAKLTADSNPGSPALPVNGAWRIVLRDASGLEYDIVKIPVVNGIASVQYTTKTKAATVHMEESDLIPIMVGETEYKIRLANEVKFRIYRVL